MKARNKVLSIVLSLVLIGTMTFVLFIKEHNYYIVLDSRKANNFISPSVENIMNHEFQDKFETAFQDQMIGRSKFLILFNRIENALNYLSSRTHNDYTLYKIGKNVYKFDKGGDYLLEFPLYKNEREDENVIKASNNINELARKYNNINFYVCQGFRLNVVDWFDEDNDIVSYGIQYRDLFSNNLDERIKYNAYYPANLEEYKKYFYKTDPHWNTYGSYEFGYKKIVDMLNENYHDLTYLEPVGEYVYENYDYYGQYGRESLYLTSPDTFIDLKFDVPNYTTIVNGKEEKYDHIQEFENGTADPTMKAYIYSFLHGNDEKEVIFNTENNNGRVLLSFVDSYSSPIKYLIASHFDKAIFIDLRLYPDFNIDEYVNEYGVTDILYLAFHGTLYSPSNIINID